MERIEIKGKEYELKINFKSVQYLNSLYPGGALEMIGKTFTGDVETFIHIIHAALFHTEKNFAFKTVEKELETKFENGEIDLETVLKTSNELVANSFFYKKMVEKLLGENEAMKEQFQKLLS